jgi:hypothetical protein
MNYLERYRQGEHRAVWAELQARGPEVRSGSLQEQGEAIARELMLRALHNVDVLIARLHALGYTFDLQPPRQALTPAELRQLEVLEQRHGPLPLALRAWYQVVGRVCLTGSHPWLSTSYRIDGGHGYRLSYLSEPLVVDLPRGPDGILVLPYVEAFGYEELTDRDEAFIPDLEDRYVLELAPNDCHKAGSSGVGPTTSRFRHLPPMDTCMGIRVTAASSTICERCSAGAVSWDCAVRRAPDRAAGLFGGEPRPALGDGAPGGSFHESALKE